MLRNLSWWALAFTVNFLFQLYRGSAQDTIIFTVALILIVLESTHLLDWIPEFKRLRKSKVNLVALLAVSVYIFFSKPDTTLTLLVFIALFFLMFFDLWRRDDGDGSKMKASEIKSARNWAAIGIALCIWELIAYVLASIYKDDFSFPTISVLLEPYLTEPLFRGVFVIIWAFLGWLLLKDWKEPS